jgi:non-ribosomal peptide synthase protein (TIGR01720 family)
MGNRLRWSRERYPLTGDDTVLQSASPGFDIAAWECLGPLDAGAAVVLAPAEAGQDSAKLAATLVLQRVTVAHFVPSLLRVLLHEPELAGCRTLRYLLTGGERVSREVALRAAEVVDAEIHNQYGPTEASLNVTFWSWRAAEEVPGGSVPIGRPLDGTRVYVADGSLRRVPIGVVGELCLGGECVTRGYLGRPAETAMRFVPDPWFASPGGRVYRTGDLGRSLADGRIEFVGRFDDQVKVRGHRVELGELEAVLRDHPEVSDAVAVAWDDLGEGLRLVVYVEAAAGAAPRPEELRAAVAERLPAPMVPATVTVLERLPLTPHGKIDRRALPEPEVHGFADAEKRLPRSRAEELVAGIWAEVLGLDEVGIDENFFELGGDSILSLQVISRARRAGLALNAREVFEHQTVAGQAAAAGVLREPSERDEPVVGPVALTPVQERFFDQELEVSGHFNLAAFLETAPGVALGDGSGLPALEGAVRALTVHHDALRARFARRPDGWHQEIAPPGAPTPFTVVDLRALPERERLRARSAAAARAQSGLDLERGPLFRALLFVLDGGADRLLIFGHHLVIDGVSWRVLLEDLEIAYRQLARGGPVMLPPKSTSIAAWSERLLAHAVSAELESEIEYWLALEGSAPGRLPIDFPGGRNTVALAEHLELALTEAETKALLQEVPATYRTHVDEVLLAALGLAARAWTGKRSVLVDLEGHGREERDPETDLSRTVGWLTAVYPVLVEVERSGEPGASLKRVKEALRRVPRRGLGFGVATQLRRDARIAGRLRSLPRAEIGFNYWGQLDHLITVGAALRPTGEPVGHTVAACNRRDHLLTLDSSVTGGRLVMTWSFSRGLHRRERVESWVEGYAAALRTLIDHCRARTRGEATPSDFTLIDVDQGQLDRLLGKFERRATGR